MNENVETFDRFVRLVDQLTVRPADARRGDAIDRILAEPPRRTEVVELRESPVIRKFRDDLVDGLVRVDTVNQLFRLLTTVLEKLPLT